VIETTITDKIMLTCIIFWLPSIFMWAEVLSSEDYEAYMQPNTWNEFIIAWGIRLNVISSVVFFLCVLWKIWN
jgi:hypothetical protein